ncbi:hypothetical protein D8M04_09285 [Oceanobacillus piezotolerans]|uniref:Phosphatidylinositol kinase n=1 Tax=Oceanobacillus piezotolerans TaxID=2448030 RepID=A0A498DHS8_9BACI|nr:hypothetical protein [Oceanobacillus piezotolerans]RLL45055.1 hypothetical protein D8M04_09285 [Oceanobacillus piezotolerans]
MKKENQMYDLCKQHVHSYVLAETVDGSTFDGIVTGLDDEYVYFAVPVEAGQQHHETSMSASPDYQRFYGYPGYGSGFPGYGFGRPPRRFNRLVLPLAGLVALSTLAWY